VLSLGTLTRKFRCRMISWMGYYLTGRTQCVRVGDYLSETIYCDSGVPQGSYLGPLFFIADINDVLDIFENVKALVYADDLKLYMRVSSTDDCRLFQQDLDRWQGWCCEKKLQVHLVFPWVETADVINDLGVLVDSRMTFVDHIRLCRSRLECWDLKRISRKFNDPYKCPRRCMWY
jgi:hypothetical protein